MNGSGKTGAFSIPAVMAVDPSLNELQVLVIGTTRELIRQTK
jgi:superfamily II DNA/RNA helicase